MPSAVMPGSLCLTISDDWRRFMRSWSPADASTQLWMGTHPTVPSSIIPPPNCPAPPDGSSIPLSSYLARHPALLGARPRYFKRPVGELPFLFKILSVGKALSIQAHPDKELGKKLHSEKPDSYKGELRLIRTARRCC